MVIRNPVRIVVRTQLAPDFLVCKTKNFADFPVLRKVAKSLIYKGYYFEVTTKKTMNLIKKVIVLCYHVSKLSLTDHKKDPKKNPFFRVFFA